MNKIFQGDSWKLAPTLEDESVDCVITSPPYWGLRDYGVSGQAGLEEHPQQWVDKMVELCELLRPKLKKSGVMFWNIGETYYTKSGSNMENDNITSKEKMEQRGLTKVQHLREKHQSPWLQSKQLLGLPWRFAIAMQDKGWILRNAIIWDKPNHMPSSVRDRFSNGYEYVFMFVKSRKYFFDLDSVREPHQTQSLERLKRGVGDNHKNTFGAPGQTPHGLHQPRSNRTQAYANAGTGSPQQNANGGIGHNINGKNPGDVWRITTKPHPFAHFAVFPEALAEKCLKAGCPEWICKKCEQPRQRITNNPYKFEWKKEQEYLKKYNSKYVGKKEIHEPGQSLGAYRNWLRENGYPETVKNETVGWSDCGCNAGFEGGLVLDPFMGSGTVAVVAQKLKRNYLGFELNPEYIKIAQNRLSKVQDWKLIKEIENGKQKTLTSDDTSENNEDNS